MNEDIFNYLHLQMMVKLRKVESSDGLPFWGTGNVTLPGSNKEQQLHVVIQ